MGPHSAVIVYCKVHDFQGYLVLPNADIDKVTTAFTKRIIDNEVLPNVSNEDGRGGTDVFPPQPDSVIKEPGERRRRSPKGRGGSNSKPPVPKGSTVEAKDNGQPSSISRGADGPGTSNGGNSIADIPQEVKSITKRRRRTRKEMEEARAKLSDNTKS